MSFLDTDRDLARHSYYDATVEREAPRSALEGDIECDVAIVGGGLAGLSAAIELADRGRIADRAVVAGIGPRRSRRCKRHHPR